MIGIVLLFVLFMYVLASALIIYVTGRVTNWLGYDVELAKNRIKILWFAPMLIWLFWDLPTIPLHKYYCATQAGFFVYKSPEQWLKEHPEVTKEDLKPLGKESDHLWDFPYKTIKNSKHRVLMLNSKLYIDSTSEIIFSFFPIKKITTHFYELSSDETLAKQITFQSGYPPSLTTGGIAGFKSWLNRSACEDSGMFTFDFKKFVTKILTLGENYD